MVLRWSASRCSAPSCSPARRSRHLRPLGDETLKLYSDDPSASRPPGGTISYEMTATRHPTAAAQHRTVVLELPEGVTFRSADYPQAARPLRG
nr:hypothetical protein GCM10020092_069470 [Actinoplanes digitatis]